MVPGRRWGTGEAGIRASEEVLLASALETVQDLNERCLVLLRQLARGQASGFPAPLAVLAPRFRDLDPSLIPGIARQPFLLMDFAFGKPLEFRGLLARQPAPLHFPTPPGHLPTAAATSLARGTLGLAHTVCRHHPAHAGILLGLDPTLCVPIAQLRLHELERLAVEHTHCLRFRWESRPDVWRRLLLVTTSSDTAARHQFRLYGMQLMAGDLNPAAPGAC